MLSFEEYLTMIRPYLKDIIDEYNYRLKENGKFIQVMQ